MAALVPGVAHLVAGNVKRLFHLLIGQPPIAVGEFQVVGAVLKEDADGLGLDLANQDGIDIAAAMRAEAAHVAEHAAEGVGTLPGRRKRADSAAAGAGDGPIVAVGREVQLVLLRDIRKQLVARNRT